ncbi:MAG: cytochrome b5 domain-containing protein [Candidatus Micrarchaeota archaeon]
MKYLILIAAALLLLGCATVEQNNNQAFDNTTVVVQNNSANLSKLTMNDVAKHNTTDDCWVVVDNMVASIPEVFAENHAGGMFAPNCGNDVSDIFDSKHDYDARQKLLNMTIGIVG